MNAKTLALPAAIAAGFAGLLALLLAGAMMFSQQPALGAAGTLNTAKVPPAYVDLIQRAGSICPDIGAPLLAAQLSAESGFNPRAVSPVGAQGIAQFMPGTWAQYGTDANGDGRADPFDPADAIPAQARYMCALVALLKDAGLGRTGDIVDLALAAYNAGPGAVLSYGGIPPYAETTTYVTKIRKLQAEFTTGLPGGSGPNPDGTWPEESCSIVPDSTTGRGCLTPRTAALAAQLRADGQRLSCWDEHAWNPTSDHPTGRACDVFPGRGGVLPTAAQKAKGDALAAALQASAKQTGVSYLIWYGQIWSVERNDEGWRPYNGGGVYNPGDVTGGHYDHIHISMY